MVKPIDPVQKFPPGTPRVSVLEVDLGENENSQHYYAVGRLGANGIRVWEIRREPANQRDDPQMVSGLTAEQIADLAHVVATCGAVI